MEAILGTKPAIAEVAAARTVTTSSASPAIAAGQKAVTPAERSERASSRNSRAGGEEAAQRDDAALRDALVQLEARLPVNVTLDIEFDDSVNRTIVRGVSTLTGETVIEVPTERMLTLIRSIRDTLGLAVDRKI